MAKVGQGGHGLDFFRNIFKHLSNHAIIMLVRDGRRVIGAAMCLIDQGVIFVPWISSLRPFFSRCPNQVLYWECMRYGINNGCHTFDFGRSSRGDGTYEAMVTVGVPTFARAVDDKRWMEPAIGSFHFKLTDGKLTEVSEPEG